MYKFLIIRFSSIGDIVLTTPVVRCLKQQIKNSEVHFLTKEIFSEILSASPYIDRQYTIRKNVSEVIPQLKKEQYDCIIDLHHNLRSAQVKLKLRKPSSSFRKLNIEKWLAVNFGINRLPDKHIVDRYMETLQPLGVLNDGRGLDYFIPDKDEVDLKILPEFFRSGYVGFVIGARYFTKQLPAEKIISICRKIDRPIVLLGGREDFQKGEIIRKELAEKIFNACGKFSINQSASLVRQAEKVITHDTGLMHIAAAFKKNIVSIWGNTIPEFGMYPYLPQTAGNSQERPAISGFSEGGSVIIEVKNLSCRPCTKLGFKKCPKGHFKCMMMVDETETAKLI